VRLLRHRLVVVGPCQIDVVRHAGGWLCDRVMAGWDATVLTTGDTDTRPLRILGSPTLELDLALKQRSPEVGPQAMAVDVELFESDTRVRRIVLGALQGGLAEVWLWGNEWPTDLDSGIVPVQHRMSVAARAFKAQALAAASAGPIEALDSVEMFRGGRLAGGGGAVPGSKAPVMRPV
jgi:hypothetical protein